MTIEITPEQEQLVHAIYESGGFDSESAVLSSALELLRQQRKLIEEVDAGVAVLDAGDYTTYTSNDREKFKANIAAKATARRTAADP